MIILELVNNPYRFGSKEALGFEDGRNRQQRSDIKALNEVYEVAKIALDLVKHVLYKHPDDNIAQEQKAIIDKVIKRIEG